VPGSSSSGSGSSRHVRTPAHISTVESAGMEPNTNTGTSAGHRDDWPPGCFDATTYHREAVCDRHITSTHVQCSSSPCV
jgi:hypothetical protein